MTYKEFVDNILETRGRFACGEEYHERHHIVPKCMGGTDEGDNLIDLFAREHFEAHRLLMLENPENEKLAYAWCCMAFFKGGNILRQALTAEEYENARITLSKLRKNFHYSNEAKHKISMSRKGQRISEETKNKIRASLKGKNSGENNYFYGKTHNNEFKSYMSNLMSEKHKGESNPFYGKHHSQELKDFFKKKYSGSGNPRATKVVQYDNNNKLIKVWECIKQASNELSIEKVTISRVCKNKGKTAGGFIWKYLYDQPQKDGTIIQGAISLGLITEEEALKQLKESET